MTKLGAYFWTLTAIATVLSGCGSSSSDLVWEDYDRTYVSLDARDGVIYSVGPTAYPTGADPVVGDLEGALGNGSHAHVFYSFETGGISGEAVIQSAVLRVYLEQEEGTPYDNGDLTVDHIDLGAGLDATDFPASSNIATWIGTLSTVATSGAGWREADVTAAVQADVASGRGYSEFRLRFQPTDSDGDLTTDLLQVNDGGDRRGTGHLPTLVVRYRAPRL